MLQLVNNLSLHVIHSSHALKVRLNYLYHQARCNSLELRTPEPPLINGYSVTLR